VAHRQPWCIAIIFLVVIPEGNLLFLLLLLFLLVIPEGNLLLPLQLLLLLPLLSAEGQRANRKE